MLWFCMIWCPVLLLMLFILVGVVAVCWVHFLGLLVSTLRSYLAYPWFRLFGFMGAVEGLDF